jgi:hypothetical protein
MGKEVRTSGAPYLRRLALTNNRMARLENGKVTFRLHHSRSKAGNRLPRPAHEGIRRFLQHGRPKGCVQVRY